MKHLVLIGFMASGKSTLASLLSQSLNLPIFSTDMWITQQVQKSISDIFDLYGESEFRLWEQKAFDVILDLKQTHIIDCGGGFVLQNNIKQLGRVYYLDTPLELIRVRLTALEREKRPLSKDFEKLYMQRKEIYGFQSHLSICEINEVLEDWKSELNAPHP